MIRRIVCLLLVPALLTSQAAMCCAHTHYDSDANDHSARIHFHVSGHNHDADASDHQHGDFDEHEHSNDSAPDDTESNSDFTARCPVDHDCDAIFVGEQDVFQFQTSRKTLGNLTFISICFESKLPRVETRSCRSQVSRAGPFSPYQCAIYLQTRCLLI